MGGLFWKKKKVLFSLGRKSFSLNVKVVPFWYEGFGLMFTKKESANSLLFSYNFSSRMTIFSSFIPYEFIAVWVDSKNKIVGLRVVKPGESGVEPGMKYRKLIEIPLNKKYMELSKFLLENKSSFEDICFVVGK